ncbi:unnamed protein product, partial [Rotaria socialis]
MFADAVNILLNLSLPPYSVGIIINMLRVVEMTTDPI